MSDRIDRATPIEKMEHAPAIMPHAHWFTMGGCRICVAVENGMWHLSISCHERDPSWDEIATARYRLVPGDITMAMLLPPLTEYVNLHQHVFTFMR